MSKPGHKLLIVSHAPSEHTRKLTEAVLRGARQAAADQLVCEWIAPLEADADDVLSAQGIILGTTENFGYMSGAMKDFFDRTYPHCLDRTEGMPWALFVRAGNDGAGAQSSIERIVTGLKWKAVQPPLICSGPWQPDFEPACEELGMTMAAGLEACVF